jgi:dTDP-4-amino-4,6-dideoxygalactose transaminase
VVTSPASVHRVDFAPWPHHEDDELAAVRRVLSSGKTNYWTGVEGREFEREYAQHLGRQHAIAVHNGTQALELALFAAGVGPGDEVITTARTFIASASAVVMRGATPVIADVDHDSGNLTVDTVAPLMTSRTKAIIPVHLGGWPADMPGLVDLARSVGVTVVEDCAQAHGAMIDGLPVGAFGDLAAFSFCQDKILTTGGEGGLLALDDESRWRSAWAFKDHGKSYAAVYERSHPPGFRWVHETFGTNWRMLEVQAAVGRLQLKKLPVWSARRREIAWRLEDSLRPVAALRVPRVPEHVRHAYYRTYLYVRPEALRSTWHRERIVAEVAEQGIPCFSGTCSEIYLEQAFVRAGLGPPGRLPVARELGETSLALLCHPTLSDVAVEEMIDVVQSVMEQATR